MSKNIDLIKYKLLKLPIRLKVVIEKGEGTPVILLHGIGKNNKVWGNVISELTGKGGFRIMAIDLLGFGDSPKPDWLEYSIEDHTSAVINTLEKLKLNHKAIVVGHSMGCLIAVRAAKLRPDLIKHLVLYEMPIFEGLPSNKLAKLRLAAFTGYYKWVSNYEPRFDKKNLGYAYRLAQKTYGFSVDQETWHPFINSLKNTILKQSISKDLKNLKIPIDVIYGSYDMLVINGHTKKTFGSNKDEVRHHKVRARHIISKKASKFIARRVIAAETTPN